MESRYDVHRAETWTLFDNVAINRFMPPSLEARQDLHQRVRLFLLSHLLGPFIGLALAGYLLVAESELSFPILTINAGVLAFWLYPAALRVTGRFTLLAFLSLQHLTLLVLFASYHFGGFKSPFFFWLLVVPLFGFFYLSDTPKLRLAVLFTLGLNVAGYVVASRMLGPPADAVFPTEMIYLASVFGAGLYVMFLALSHARLLAKQTVLERESEAQRLLSAQLLSAKEAAEAANRAKSEFLATTSHELRTPLNAVIGFSQLIRQQHFGSVGEKYLGYAKNIEDSGTHLLEIINDILDVAKAETGRFELSEERVDLGEIIATAVRLLEARALNAGLSVTVDMAPDLPELWADPRRIKQVILNLLGNAIKFTPSGGAIRISAEVQDGDVSVAVSDTGVGIAQEHLENVVKPFFQVDSSLARSNEGVGMGLALASNVMARHGGTLTITSTVGKGTQARLVFPRSRALDTRKEAS